VGRARRRPGRRLVRSSRVDNGEVFLRISLVRPRTIEAPPVLAPAPLADVADCADDADAESEPDNEHDNRHRVGAGGDNDGDGGNIAAAPQSRPFLAVRAKPPNY
jgi:hypothetical protein